MPRRWVPRRQGGCLPWGRGWGYFRNHRGWGRLRLPRQRGLCPQRCRSALRRLFTVFTLIAFFANASIAIDVAAAVAIVTGIACTLICSILKAKRAHDYLYLFPLLELICFPTQECISSPKKKLVYVLTFLRQSKYIVWYAWTFPVENISKCHIPRHFRITGIGMILPLVSHPILSWMPPIDNTACKAESPQKGFWVIAPHEARL